VMKMLVQLNQEGTTILMVTHAMENASYSSRIIRLYDGQIMSEEQEAKANG
jgi:putative ABC transport system ATP-binding protein